MSIFGVILVRIFPHSDWIRRDTEYLPYSVRMRENVDQNNSEYGHFFTQYIFEKAELNKIKSIFASYN